VFLPLLVFIILPIPDSYVKNYRSVKNRAMLSAAGVFILILAMGYGLHLVLDITPAKVAKELSMPVATVEDILSHPKLYPYKYQFITQTYDLTPYALIYAIFLAIAAAIAVYLRQLYAPKSKHQADIMRMEDEFKDAVYVLASRMGEGKPLENALLAVNENLPETKIARIFERIAYNIRVLGLTIRDAVFSPAFGVLKNIPSKRLHDAFDVLVSSVTLGTELAAKALVVLSEQLRDEEDVVKSIRTKLSEIAGMMMLMGMFVAPAVLGITIALEKVIMNSLSGLDLSGAQSSDVSDAMSQFGLNTKAFSSIGNSQVLSMPSWVFLAAVGIMNYLVWAVFAAAFAGIIMVIAPKLAGPMEPVFLKETRTVFLSAYQASLTTLGCQCATANGTIAYSPNFYLTEEQVQKLLCKGDKSGSGCPSITFYGGTGFRVSEDGKTITAKKSVRATLTVCCDMGSGHCDAYFNKQPPASPCG